MHLDQISPHPWHGSDVYYSTRFNLAKSDTYINCLINVYYRPIEDCVCSIEGPQKCLTAGHTQCCRTQLWGSFWIMLVFSGLTFKISTESGSTMQRPDLASLMTHRWSAFLWHSENEEQMRKWENSDERDSSERKPNTPTSGKHLFTSPLPPPILSYKRGVAAELSIQSIDQSTLAINQLIELIQRIYSCSFIYLSISFKQLNPDRRRLNNV